MPAPRCIVEVRWGKLGGTKVAVEPGNTLRVGRGDMAHLAVRHDSRLSAVHFDLAWDGERCTLRDLRSMTGTHLNGELVTEAEVEHGAWIHAGDTDVMVYVEARTPPPADEEDEGDEADEEARGQRARRHTLAERALEGLRDASSRIPLYAILDAARDDRILELLRESVERHQSLYEGLPGEPLEEVAPYLAGPMDPSSTLLSRLVREGWGRRWGIYCTSLEPFREVRRHFRRFLMVELEASGERVYFRFYDPGVLGVFFPVCTPLQIQEMLGANERILYEAPDGGLASIGAELATVKSFAGAPETAVPPHKG
ncbi:hypothetical protein BE17_52985 [Sorangium cellulosum]|uniref:FHA domain-containing protein n=1 Tax=Sorangium cellulosum TaxID=56 RepID=A0A150RW98_SORCE|nr:hypothetical protein BE17_52985 [Sorangium cellulosum]